MQKSKLTANLGKIMKNNPFLLISEIVVLSGILMAFILPLLISS